MDSIVLQGRFSVLELQQAGPAAVIAVDMVLNSKEEWYLNIYKSWLRKEIKKQKDEYIKDRHLFEKNGTLEEYNNFKLYYFTALESCTTSKELFKLYLEKTELVWAQITLPRK